METNVLRERFAIRLAGSAGRLDLTSTIYQALGEEERNALFTRSGGAIYDFQEALCERLKNTDFGVVTFDAITLPYRALYLHFRGQAQYRLVSGAFEGVYVIDLRDDCGAFVFAFTAAEMNATPNVLPVHAPSVIRIEGVADGTEIHGAVAHVLADKFDRYSRAKDASAEFVEQLRIEYESSLPIALSLAINALLFITAVPAGISIGWQDDAPADLALQAESGKTWKKKRDATKALWREGYSIVRLCRDPAESGTDAANTQGAVIAHWRRGHWRWQAHGPALSERALRWIRPTIVNAGAGPVLRHVYEVGDQQ